MIVSYRRTFSERLRFVRLKTAAPTLKTVVAVDEGQVTVGKGHSTRMILRDDYDSVSVFVYLDGNDSRPLDSHFEGRQTETGQYEYKY